MGRPDRRALPNSSASEPAPPFAHEAHDGPRSRSGPPPPRDPKNATSATVGPGRAFSHGVGRNRRRDPTGAECAEWCRMLHSPTFGTVKMRRNKVLRRGAECAECYLVTQCIRGRAHTHTRPHCNGLPANIRHIRQWHRKPLWNPGLAVPNVCGSNIRQTFGNIRQVTGSTGRSGGSCGK